MRILLLLFISILLNTKHLCAQLITKTSFAPATMIENELFGAGVKVSNVVYTGDPFAIGSFSGKTNLGIASGIVLASNYVSEIAGPNLYPNGGHTTNGTNDVDLNIIAGSVVYEAAVIEFDFYSTSNKVSFDYVFGSDEYPEYVGSQYNDVFGFFISGPGIAGPFSNNAVNIALIPNTNTPVAINNVNHKINTQYYVSNPLNGQFPPESLDSTKIEYDGFTTVLTASYEIQPCKTYHIKIAVGDVGDGAYGSGVFIKAGSFDANSKTNVNYSSGNNLLEGCKNTTVSFDLGENKSSAYTIDLSYYGSALNGVDVDLLPASIVVPSGQKTATLNVSAIADKLTEGAEKLYIIAKTSSCSEDTAEIIINDNIPLSITNPTTLTSCGANATITAQIDGGVGTIKYDWTPALSTSSQINFDINANPNIELKVSDECGNSDTKVFSATISPPMMQKTKDTTLCSGASVIIGEPAEIGYTYKWITNAHLDKINTSQATFNHKLNTGESSTQYTQILLKSQGACDNRDTVVITVQAPPISNIETNAPSCYNLCDATAIDKSGAKIYIWQDSKKNNIGSNANLSNICAGKYYLTFTDNAGCSNIDSINIMNPEKLKIKAITKENPKCFGSSDGSINIVSITGTSPYTYSWSNGDNSANNSNLPKGIYSVNIQDAYGCKTDSTINLQEPEELKINVISDSTICSNSCLQIKATSKGGTGNITFNWQTLGAGANQNLCIQDASKSFSVWATDENACTTPVKEVTVHPINKPEIKINANNLKNMYCSGEEIILTANAQNGKLPYQYLWEPSAANNQNNKVYPTQNTTYKVRVKDACNALSNTDSLVVQIKEKPLFTYAINAPSSCSPANAELNNTSKEVFKSIKWKISSGNTNKYESNSSSYNVTLINAGIYTMEAEVITTEGCTFTYNIPNTIEVWQNPTANFSVNEEQISIKNPIIITNNESTNASKYEWKFFDKNNNGVYNSINATYAYSDTGSYNIQLIAISNKGCRDSITKSIVIKPIFTLFVPNAFTPNNDGKNDQWQVIAHNYKEIKIMVFDRWGQLTYESNKIEDGWNGTYLNSGNTCQIDTYVYLISATDYDNKDHSTTGIVTIIR